jgi:hypothetical protein
MPRPQLKPTDEQRRLVKSMAAMGTPQEHISRKIGIRSPKTLRKYFRDELDFGMTEANYKVAQTLFQMATSGKCIAATQFWLKTRGRFRESPQDEVRKSAPPPFVVAREAGAPVNG